MDGQRLRARTRPAGPDEARLFFALWPPLATAERLHRWACAAREVTGGRAIGADSIHLTLAFLGGIPAARIEQAIAAARRVQASAHALPLERIACSARRGLVWIGPGHAPPPLAALARALRAELTRCGFVLEPREFLAHVTLLRHAKAAARLPAPPALAWPVTEFALARSRLGSGPARYEIVARFALAPGEEAEATAQDTQG